MMLPLEFVTRWGANDLITYDPTIVQALRIPEPAKSFLVEAGLPRSMYITYDVSPNDFPPLPSITERDYVPPHGLRLIFSEEYRRYRVIGMGLHKSSQENAKKELVSCHCLDEERNGEIVVISRSRNTIDDWEVRFLNSSVSQLAEFLLLIREHHEWRKQVFEKEESKPSTWTLQRYLEEGKEPDRFGEAFDQNVISHGQDVVRSLWQIDPHACAEDAGWSEAIAVINSGIWL